MLGLNLGCGECHLKDYINVDIDIVRKPALVFDIAKPFPFKDNTFDQILLIHVIEHILEKDYPLLLFECHRVLKEDGFIFISYPEFVRCAQNYINNYRGLRDFWKCTIYGRQLTKDDFHVSLMDTKLFKVFLEDMGFKDLIIKPEPTEVENHNTMIKAFKGIPRPSREDIFREEIFGS